MGWTAACRSATVDSIDPPGKNEANAATYDRLSRVYDRAARNPLFERPRARMFELAAIRPTDRVLIVGVGTGLDLLHVPAGAAVTGIDVSRAMLARAEARAANGTVTLRRMSAERLTFDAESFDVVVMSCVLTVVEDPRLTLAEAARVLRPGGAIWIMSKFCEAPPGAVRRGLDRVLMSVGGATVTLSLVEAIGVTPLHVTLHEPALAVDIFRLEHA